MVMEEPVQVSGGQDQKYAGIRVGGKKVPVGEYVEVEYRWLQIKWPRPFPAKYESSMPHAAQQHVCYLGSL